jgi:hypothetical protein
MVKAAPMEAVKFIIDSAQEAKMGILGNYGGEL